MPSLCQAMDRRTAEIYLQQLDGWELQEDRCGRLHLLRTYPCKSFDKALTLCKKIAAVSEAEGHFPELHLTKRNGLVVGIYTHARQGITENDAILASKIDSINKAGLVHAKKVHFREA